MRVKRMRCDRVTRSNNDVEVAVTLAKGALLCERDTAVTMHPSALASLIAVEPNPPMPTMPTRVPDVAPCFLSGSYDVIPAHLERYQHTRSVGGGSDCSTGRAG